MAPRSCECHRGGLHMCGQVRYMSRIVLRSASKSALLWLGELQLQNMCLVPEDGRMYQVLLYTDVCMYVLWFLVSVYACILESKKNARMLVSAFACVASVPHEQHTQTHDLHSFPLTCNRTTRVLTFVAICHRCKVLGSCCPHTGCFLTNEQVDEEDPSVVYSGDNLYCENCLPHLACSMCGETHGWPEFHKGLSYLPAFSPPFTSHYLARAMPPRRWRVHNTAP